MDRWIGTTAIVTGASAGIGAAIAKALVEKGVNVVGLARRVEKIQELADSLSEAPGQLHALKCDVTKEEDIIRSFKWCNGRMAEGLRRERDGVCICTREAVRVMRANDIAGHIVNMNSVLGHRVPNLPVPVFNVYPASKFAVTALTQSLKHELHYHGTQIKITSISPGYVKTEFEEGFPEDGIKGMLEQMLALRPEDVADGVLYALSTPPTVQVQELTLCAIGEPV
ncbi:hypothetical protein NQ317_012327 [Molorchus minor]|uniref:Dehydrogenase/reductase SDR family member 11 n=1 Tax=Molorchus minor TaxID=1323400 RepID=A0ABQ9IS91_9CUCU|nr:hypothetical protein NQ317_012327 [Molorchus minor]